MIKDLDTVQFVMAHVCQNSVVAGQFNDKVNIFTLQKGGVIGCRAYAEAFSMPSANGIFIGVGHADDMSLQMNRGVRLEKAKDVITSFTTTDKGYI